MSIPAPIQRDERTLAVENAGYRLVYLLLSFALLADVAYRGLVRRESAWDLFGLVIGAGVVATAYQATHRVISAKWVKTAIVAFFVSLTVAAAVALMR
jgi:hypothetical protein